MLLFVIALNLCSCILRAADNPLPDAIAALPQITQELLQREQADWLVTPIARKAGVYRTNHANEIVMSNGLVSRTFRLAPNAATVGLDDLVGGRALLRGVKPEAQVTLNDTAYPIGGLVGQPNYAYLLPEWVEQMKADPAAFRCVKFEVGKAAERFAWKKTRYAGESTWPPMGVSLVLTFAAPSAPPAPTSSPASVPTTPALPPGVTVDVHYEMYDGIPLMAKWLTIRNGSDAEVRLQTFMAETLAVVETGGLSGRAATEPPGSIHVESDYGYMGSDASFSGRGHWVRDPQYQTQVDYSLGTRCLLECRPAHGPDQAIPAGASFETFRVFELIHDANADADRRGLAQRRMYRTLAPWASENPIMLHVVSVDPAVVKTAIDQCAAVGFEMVILSFGSGLNMEDVSDANIAKFRDLADYAHAKGIRLGGYSLLASRSISPDMDVIDAKTGAPGGAAFGSSPCLLSQWGIDYFNHLEQFIARTGFDLLEHDGSYPGDVCASTKHVGHRGLEDSQYAQWQKIAAFYHRCRAAGVYLNVPDWYYLSGSNKNGMGYRETNWSLPREQQIIHGRQNIYDGTWEKTPSMGWMFVPLTQYHGGGAAATIEPLSEHLDAYEAHLANNFGAGVQACYRGTRLFDTDQTRDVVKKWVDFYKKYRPILDSDIIHVRRADGRDIDCILHVNPRLKQKALAMLFNPLDRKVTKTIRLPLYYTGLTETAEVSREDGPPQRYTLDRQHCIEVPVEIAPRSRTWLSIQ
jgi:hypothetical protein